MTIGHKGMAANNPSQETEEGNGVPLPVFSAQQAGSTDSLGIFAGTHLGQAYSIQ